MYPEGEAPHLVTKCYKNLKRSQATLVILHFQHSALVFETMLVPAGLRSWNNVVSDTFNRFELPLVLRAPEAIYD